MHFFPILHYDDQGNCYREQYCQRSGHLERNIKSEQWNGHQAFPKAEGGTNKSSEEHDQKNVQRDGVDGLSPTEI
jgi:hypothetical protein